MNLKAIPPEYALLLLSVRKDNIDILKQETRTVIASDNPDWDYLLELSKIHFIEPQVLTLFEKTDTTSLIPDFVNERLNESVKENLIRQLRNVSEFLQIEYVLTTNNIPVVPFKGFWLGSEMYGDVGARISGDVDLFFRIADFDRMFGIMMEQGFKPETSSSPRIIKKEKRWSAEFNFEKYEKDKKVVHIEFHWKIGSAFHGLDISFEDLASRVITGRINQNDIKVFDPSANFLLTVMHHGGKDPFVRLKHVFDISRLMEKKIDWDWVSAMARRFKMERLIFLAVSLSNQICGTAVPAEIAKEVASPVIKKLTANRIEAILKTKGMEEKSGYYYDRLFFQLKSRTGLFVKLKLLCIYGKAFLVNHLSVGKI